VKAGAVNLPVDVTRLLYTQRRDRILSTGKPSLFFSEEPTRSEVPGMTPGKFLKSAASQLPSKNCRVAAVGKMRSVDVVSVE